MEYVGTGTLQRSRRQRDGVMKQLQQEDLRHRQSWGLTATQNMALPKRVNKAHITPL